MTGPLYCMGKQVGPELDNIRLKLTSTKSFLSCFEWPESMWEQIMSLLYYVTSWYWETIEREPNWELTQRRSASWEILHWPFPASLSCPPRLPLHTDFPYVLRFISSVLCIYTCVHLGLWTWVQAPQEPKGVRCYAAGVTVSCDPLTWILGTELQSMQQALRTTDPSLSRFVFQWGIKCELVPPCSLGSNAQDTVTLWESSVHISLGPSQSSSHAIATPTCHWASSRLEILWDAVNLDLDT